MLQIRDNRTQNSAHQGCATVNARAQRGQLSSSTFVVVRVYNMCRHARRVRNKAVTRNVISLCNQPAANRRLTSARHRRVRACVST